MTRISYGERFNAAGNNDQFSISRPTIELGLDGVLFNDEPSAGSNSSGSPIQRSTALEVSRVDFHGFAASGINDEDKGGWI